MPTALRSIKVADEGRKHCDALCSWLLESPDSPVFRRIPGRQDIDAVIDVPGAVQELNGSECAPFTA